MIKIYIGTKIYELEKDFIFSGGEIQVRLPNILPNYSQNILIETQLLCSDDIIKLILVKNALDTYYDGVKIANAKIKFHLQCLYFPYARQDRVCYKGEAFSLKVVANLINDLYFDSVIVADPHSNILYYYLNNIAIINQIYILKKIQPFVESHILIGPDAGAAIKTKEAAKYFNCDYGLADKIRDSDTGNIIGIEPKVDDLDGHDLLIIDDICDGGRTFIELAKVLKENHNPGKICLYVTHGIFSKGFKIFEGLIDKIITTNSLPQKENNSNIIIDYINL